MENTVLEKRLAVALLLGVILQIYLIIQLKESKLHHEFALRTLAEATTAGYRCESVKEQCCR